MTKYEELSKNICVICGRKGMIDYNQSYLIPLCQACTEESML